MLKIENARIEKGSFRLECAALELAPRARVAVIGPSGAGKSTLLEAIAGFVELLRGDMLWAGQSIADLAPGKRPVSMLFQDGNLFPHLSLADNVALGINANRKLNSRERDRVMEAIARVGLKGLERRRPAELSGGQQSRAALARVLVQGRDLLCLDEPFAALGPALKAEMLDLVANLVGETGATLLMVSHDPADARRICDQLVVVADGQVSPAAPTDATLANPPEALRAYLG